jgi:hypothetical protein
MSMAFYFRSGADSQCEHAAAGLPAAYRHPITYDATDDLMPLMSLIFLLSCVGR